MLARRHHDAEPGAGIDVDMGIHAALADQAQLRQAREQRCADLGALANQHQRLGVAQALREPFVVLQVVVPDGDLMALELAEALQGAQRVEVVVEDGDSHGWAPFDG
jgi:hypothetical protein